MTNGDINYEITKFIGQHYPAGVIAFHKGQWKAITVSYCNGSESHEGQTYAAADTIEELAEKLRGPTIGISLQKHLTEAMRN